MLDSFFGLKEQRTTVHGELLAGLITFLTMAYIIVVQPHVLSQTGMDLSDDDRHAARLLDSRTGWLWDWSAIRSSSS